MNNYVMLSWVSKSGLTIGKLIKNVWVCTFFLHRMKNYVNVKLCNIQMNVDISPSINHMCLKNNVAGLIKTTTPRVFMIICHKLHINDLNKC